MAAINAGGSLVVTHDYHRRRIGSTSSSSSSCGSSEFSGEILPHHHPGLPKQDSGHWWSRFFFGKQNQPGMTTLMEEAQQKTAAMTLTNGQVTCVAREMVMKRQVSDVERSESASPPPS
uniref:pancreatic progenitor cell differentiation and proliferation factor B-like n=1 Tax=Oncorhynchus gorbuscha TaxID=8017 RepID=UPI001EAE92B5|nr:pancreatic progenitor cell differentiation and proliferation factor B-like [Oncorhynchus gorbuscha]